MRQNIGMTWGDSVRRFLNTVQWLVGVTCITACIGAIDDAPFFALGALVLGVWLLPQVRRFLLKQMGEDVGKIAKWVVPIVAFVVLAVNTPEPEPVPGEIPKGLESLAEQVNTDEASVAEEESEETFVVRHVIDGDTFILENDERVRLIGINAPERDAPFYDEATELLRELVEGQAVRLEQDVNERDQYERLLAYVYVGETFVNRELVAAGLAESRAYEPDVSRQAELDAAEEEARQAGRGLWQ